MVLLLRYQGRVLSMSVMFAPTISSGVSTIFVVSVSGKVCDMGLILHGLIMSIKFEFRVCSAINWRFPFQTQVDKNQSLQYSQRGILKEKP